MDLDEDLPDVKGSSPPRAPQVLKGVVIPTNSRSSTDSSLSSVRDLSSEYDTPATSAVATPAESFAREGKSRTSLRRTENPAKGKRKRVEFDDVTEGDADLARMLQEKEFEEEPQIGPRSRKAFSGLVVGVENEEEEQGDDDNDDDPLSDIKDSSDDLAKPRRRKSNTSTSRPPRRRAGKSADNDSSDEDDVLLPRKKAKTALRTSLPSRAARESASKSLKDTNFRQLLEIDDSEVSDLRSDDLDFDVDSDIFKDFDETDGSQDEDNASEVNDIVTASAAVATTSTASSRAQVARRRPGGRRRFRLDQIEPRVNCT